jgi:hypothetical protein
LTVISFPFYRTSKSLFRLRWILLKAK